MNINVKYDVLPDFPYKRKIFTFKWKYTIGSHDYQDPNSSDDYGDYPVLCNSPVFATKSH